MQGDPTVRFTGLVEDYQRYRPGYPAAVLELLIRACGLSPGAAVADVGSGTGKLTELLLSRAARVYAVEPNRGMREAAERLLGAAPGFVSVAGTAEDTGLADSSIDLVTAAQAFHWFDAPRARAEFRRILRPGGKVALIWNERAGRLDRDGRLERAERDNDDERESECLAGYERIMREFSVDYHRVDHRRTASSEAIASFFGGSAVQTAEFPNSQELDLAGLQGRYRSSSYALSRDHPRFAEAMDRLAELFQKHQRGGRLAIAYRCRLYWGSP